ncbi:hypothetical protein B0I37DRAFT_372002 [Chaetomium sp. MPI-CAGE-AT-0009]|nr:hypothetical protein B0I37DRAFT_372002 [Chaetomium sp. MPI-CAGE-AT-0009]
MATSTAQTAVLSPLDQYMPRIYTTLFLIFETSDPTNAVDKLRAGLRRLNQRLPYLKGRVFATDGGRAAIRWSPTDEDVKLQEMPTDGLVLPGLSFEKLKAERAPLHYFPPTLSPLPRFANLNSDSGAAVFAANYGLLDGGVVLGLSVEHNVMDGTGVVELIRFWAACTRSDTIDTATTPTPDPDEPLHRSQLLPTPSTPLPSPPGTSKIFTFATAQLEATKTALQTLHSTTPSTTATWLTTNSVLCAILWSCITRVRQQRRARARETTTPSEPSSPSTTAAATARSQLGFAINGRARLGPGATGLGLADPRRPFLGNVNLYGLAGVDVGELEQATSTATTADGSSVVAAGREAALGRVVQAIGEGVGRVTGGFVGEVMELAERAAADGGGPLAPGWDAFHGRDVTVTSWANMGLYGAEFGEGVGRPCFMRVPRAETDGFAIVLPRRRGGEREEGIEVVVAMHPEDMAALEGDAVWRSYLV